jgi:hypothetical protein
VWPAACAQSHGDDGKAAAASLELNDYLVDFSYRSLRAP